MAFAFAYWNVKDTGEEQDMSERVGRVSLICGLVLALLLSAGCLGQDHLDIPLTLNEWDHGWLATIEPGEQLEVSLTGNALYPEVPWQVTEFDSAVIDLQGEQHIPPAGDSADRENLDPGDPLVPFTGFSFVGMTLGESPLVFEFVVDGERIDIAKFAVEVVEDACESEVGAVANWCGRDFSFHPQDLTEWDHGGLVALEPGDELDVSLTANALHPDRPWQIIEFDSAVIGLEGPEYVAPNRSSGDWSPWEPDSRHSFLPTWNSTIVGIALGESRLVLGISVDGTPVDGFELTVVVVEDACAIETRMSTCGQ